MKTEEKKTKKELKLPSLYKKTSTGAIEKWTIRVIEEDSFGVIYTSYGQVDGKIQVTSDTVKEGKNLGKINSTTPFEQAKLEAIAKHKGKVKKGYVEGEDRAEAGETNIEGGVFPMLAHKFSEQGHKIKYPCYVQPKLDGIRCTSEKNGNLWTRTRQPITSVPHLQDQIIDLDLGAEKLDGELYNHAYHNNFEHIVHLVRQETPTEGYEVVQYWVYDVMLDDPNATFEERLVWLRDNIPQEGSLRLVETLEVNSEEELMEVFEQYLLEGFEGAIVRNKDGKYLNKRSYDLQKIKTMDTEEFEITGVKEGRGKLQGHAIFLCKIESGEEFEVKLQGSFEKLKEVFEDDTLWKGKQLTVRFQGYTNKNKVPRFPVGVAVRDYE